MSSYSNFFNHHSHRLSRIKLHVTSIFFHVSHFNVSPLSHLPVPTHLLPTLHALTLHAPHHLNVLLILKIGSKIAITINPTNDPTTKINAGAINEINVLIRALI